MGMIRLHTPGASGTNPCPMKSTNCCIGGNRRHKTAPNEANALANVARLRAVREVASLCDFAALDGRKALD
jgi:hypothetical protein